MMCGLGPLWVESSLGTVPTQRGPLAVEPPARSGTSIFTWAYTELRVFRQVTATMEDSSPTFVTLSMS